MDVIAHRRLCDELWNTAIQVTVGGNVITEELIDWFDARGYKSRGITPDPMSVWFGHDTPSYFGSRLIVAFHHSRANDAMLFKLTFA